MHQLPLSFVPGPRRRPFPISVEKIRLLIFVASALGFGCQWMMEAELVAAEVPHSQYVLLRNDHVLQGTVTSKDNLITVRRDVDAELTIRTDQVLAVRDDLQSLFAVRQSMKRRGSRVNVADLIDDARWCVNQNMPGQATALLLRVYRVAPNHSAALQLEKRLRQSIAPTNQVEPQPEVSQSSFTASETIRNDVAVENKKRHSRLVTATAAPEDLHWFTSRVQPILISRCGQCHHSEASTEWKLDLPTYGMRVPQKGTINNLDSTLKYCNAGVAESSKLLDMARTFHGRTNRDARRRDEPPIAQHEIRLINTIASWINQLAPTDLNFAVDSDADLMLDDEKQESTGPLAQVEPSRVAAELSRPPVPRVDPSSQWSGTDISGKNASSSKPRMPVRLPVVQNPNDVRHYNREIEIRRKFGL